MPLLNIHGRYLLLIMTNMWPKQCGYIGLSLVQATISNNKKGSIGLSQVQDKISNYKKASYYFVTISIHPSIHPSIHRHKMIWPSLKIPLCLQNIIAMAVFIVYTGIAMVTDAPMGIELLFLKREETLSQLATQEPSNPRSPIGMLL